MIPTADQKRKVFQVAEVTRLIKSILEDEVGYVWIEGEVSNASTPSSGHIYFTLKDEKAQIRAALFRGNQRNLPIAIENGAKIRAYGRVTVYERSGSYQLIVEKVEPAGIGDLHKAFEALKKKLSEEGLFDEERKQPLPLLPQRIGIVTSATGAAIRDMLHVLTRRFPNINILIAPSAVQGEGAASQIAQAIDHLNQHGQVDVIIIGRGGGSLEDLWCFNEEIVARAIAGSALPIVSAVGHETDFTISDFVADVRAATPSAAAELVVGLKEHFEAQLGGLCRRLGTALTSQVLRLRNRVTAAAQSYSLREPTHLVERHRRHLDSLREQMAGKTSHFIRNAQQQVDELGLKMSHQATLRTKSCRLNLETLKSQLRALNPSAVLDRGYSITRDDKGNVVTVLEDIEMGDTLETQLAKGIIASKVIAKEKRET